MQAQKRSAVGKRVASGRRATDPPAPPPARAERRWWKGWPVEGFSVSQWPLFARRCKARGNDLVPLRRSCRAATRFTFASRRHCGSPSPEGGTANAFLGTCTPTPCTLPYAPALSLPSIAPFLLTFRWTSIEISMDRGSSFFLNVLITIDKWNFHTIE